MKKILMFILLLFVPFIVKAEARNLVPVVKYNTGFAYAYPKDGYIYGVRGTNNGKYLEKMNIKGETVYDIPMVSNTDNHSYNVFTLNNNIFVIDAIEREERYHYDVYLLKYDIETGEKLDEISFEDFYTTNIGRSINYDDDRVQLFDMEQRKYYIVDTSNFNHYESTTKVLTYDFTIFEAQFEHDVHEVVDVSTVEGLKDFMLENGSDAPYVYETNDYYFFPYLTNTNMEGYMDKELKNFGVLDILDNGNIFKESTEIIGYTSRFDMEYQLETIYQLNEKQIVLIYQKFETRCMTAYHPDSYQPGPCGGFNAVVAIYDTIYNVTTKTDGNGEVKVSSNSNFEGDGVTFEIIPKEGYVLSEVKVTDANGNVVTFKDYKFTMPSADVTIEAKFVKSATNPNTKDLIGLFITIIVLSLITFVYNFVNKERKETI